MQKTGTLQSGNAAPILTSGPDIRKIAALSIGHLVVDMIQGAVPAVLPILKMAHGLTYAASGTLVLVGNTTSSLVQPVFGLIADRASGRWMLPLAVLVTGLGMAFSGIVRSYPLLLVMFLLMSLGVAAYHPEGFRLTGAAAGRRRGTALSWFSFGGNIGYSLGPPVITLLVTDLGTYGTAGMLLPALLMSAGLWFELARSARPVASRAVSDPGHGQSRPHALGILMFVVFVRSWAHLGFLTYLPFFYVDHLGLAPRIVGPLMFVYLGSGALGTVCAGPLADRFGPKSVMVGGMIGAVPLGALFLCADGVLSWILLGLFGAVLISTATITVLLSQQFLPHKAGLASGLVVGLAIGAGGLGVAALGWVADHFGLPTVLWTCALMPLLGFAASLLLPARGEKQAQR